ncbi:hypothetical protein EX30DRAFT_58903 [Ascodesmis nigricans]|uniref:Uncharacterized protein n=1 Tax=Ascodesmis nigricans TaxID=341454 RepID=A0A4S2MV05_9PEZI|nr:hypothetical protein EX30DRAFT_58903 [Ascodesmis nigricans]
MGSPPATPTTAVLYMVVERPLGVVVVSAAVSDGPSGLCSARLAQGHSLILSNHSMFCIPPSPGAISSPVLLPPVLSPLGAVRITRRKWPVFPSPFSHHQPLPSASPRRPSVPLFPDSPHHTFQPPRPPGISRLLLFCSSQLRIISRSFISPARAHLFCFDAQVFNPLPWRPLCLLFTRFIDAIHDRSPANLKIPSAAPNKSRHNSFIL